jgi:phage/plasmid primase-like uncharacterized protein
MNINKYTIGATVGIVIGMIGFFSFYSGDNASNNAVSNDKPTLEIVVTADDDKTVDNNHEPLNAAEVVETENVAE